jgi:DNA-binding transcriptional regulator YiaG
MTIARRTRADIDKAKLLAKLATRPPLSEEEIDAQAIEDADAWTDEELADAEPVYPPPSPDQVRALRAKRGLTQAQFARRFGFHARHGAAV